MFILAERCPRCSGTTAGGYCRHCRGEFRTIVDPCGRCGLPKPQAACPLEGAPWQVDRVIAPLIYRPPLQQQMHALKYRGARRLARAMALLLAERLQSAGPQFDALIPVPMAPSRRRQRGYNQASEIARPLALALGAHSIRRGIRRLPGAEPQSVLSKASRNLNLSGIFIVDAPLNGTRLMIVDDVITTGATVNALAAALKAAGAQKVFACAVARTLRSTEQEFQ